MGFLSEMHASLPGIDALRTNVEKVITWGPWEHNRAFIIGGVIDGAARDAGNDPTTHLRPGLMLGQIRSSEGTDPLKFKEWDPTATDGTQDLAGILLWDAHMQMFSSNKDRWFGYVLVGGNVKSKAVLYPGESSHGLDGLDEEYYAKGVLASRFLLDDYPHLNAGSPIMGGWKSLVNKTADYTVVPDDNGTLFTTIGNAADIEFTLPAVAKSKGLRFGFANCEDYELMVSAAADNDIIGFNDIAAGHIALTTTGEQIGGMVEVIGLDNNKWLAITYGPHTVTAT